MESLEKIKNDAELKIKLNFDELLQNEKVTNEEKVKTFFKFYYFYIDETFLLANIR